MNKKVVKLLNKYTSDRDSKKVSQQGEDRVRKKRMFLFGSAMIILMLVLVSVGIHQKYENRNLEQDIVEIEEVLDDKNDTHEALEQEISQLNDDDYIRRIARSEFFMSEDGETVFSLPKSKSEHEKKEDNHQENLEEE